MKNNVNFSIYSLCLMVIFIFLSNVYAFGQESNQTVTDIDGNVYKTVTIGTQTWMAENLKTTKYNNRNLIGTTTPATLSIEAENTPKYQWAYAGNESNVATYGRLYTWYAVTDSRGVCPTGWHIPSDSEWTTLTTYLEGKSVAGDKLKEVGTSHWKTPNTDAELPNTGATNETGFTALPGGFRAAGLPDVIGDNLFLWIGHNGSWWSSTEGNYSTDAWDRGMGSLVSSVVRDTSDKAYGSSVRCIRD